MSVDKDKVEYALIQSTLDNLDYYLDTHNSICVSVSGGSDSNIIVHMVAKYFRQYLDKIHFVFENTGLEYRATVKHLKYMESVYDINIETISAAPHDRIVPVVRREGVPIISKEYSNVVNGLQKGKPWALRRFELTSADSKYALSKKQKKLAMYLIGDNGMKVSSVCCDLSKKKPLHEYVKRHKIDLNITGERLCEGGARSSAHKSCFEEANPNSHRGMSHTDKYMPLWFWDDITKQYYKEAEGIVYSDCYEVWGMRRTGCVGCPFNSKVGEDLEKIKIYEPNMYKACMNVFGESYRVMDMFEMRKKRIIPISDNEV